VFQNKGRYYKKCKCGFDAMLHSLCQETPPILKYSFQRCVVDREGSRITLLFLYLPETAL
jgi:hypothetical protein